MIRFLDFIISLLGLALFLPAFLVIAIIIKIDSPGGIFYSQVRVGKENKDFNLLKFRTMYKGSDKKGLLTVGNNDPRVSRAGKFLRKFKLDELPQIINVIKGEMSLVGPRPEVRKYVNLYDEKQRKILSVRPGLTDMASIYYKNENEILAGYDNPEKAYIEIVMPHKIEMNMQFINEHSLKNYLKIIFITIFKIFN